MLIITPSYVSNNTASAVRINALVNALKKRTFAPTVITLENTNKLCNTDDQCIIKKSYMGIASSRDSLYKRVVFEILCGLSVLVMILQSSEKHVLISSPPFVVLALAFVAKLIKRITIVVDVRDVYPEQLFSHGVVSRYGTMGKVLLWIERIIYNHSELVFGATGKICRHIEEKTSTSVKCWRNGVDIKKFDIDNVNDDEDIIAPKLVEDNFVILFHGTLGLAYDWEIFVKYGLLLREKGIDDIKILVVGSGSGLEKLRDQKVQKSLSDIIHIYDRVSSAKIPRLLSGADVGLVPLKSISVNELAFPVKVYEYIAAKIPIIMTNVGEAARLVATDNLGYIIDNSEPNLVHEVVSELQRSAKHNEIAKNCERIKGKYDRVSISANIADILNDFNA